MVAGGQGDGYLDSVYLYSVDAATWSASTKMPVVRGYFGIACIPAHGGGGRGQVMVAGGYVGGKNYDSVHLYSMDAATWSVSTKMPVARRGFGIAYIPAHDGGGGGASNGGRGYDDSNRNTGRARSLWPDLHPCARCLCQRAGDAGRGAG